ncbi:Keratin, type I cytoskeletal 18 [Saguinus oedipus]|uniref:Keratin, type I cytoskeletal 18 n=1 Tax=Saguinus oedipus TaxID=9490 RepID=A0ABQ9TGD7_SAGOE|nr:Keratin, type I cytoskeletal 18 [Saguinus oedipus]
MEIKQLNVVLLHLESELAETQAKGRQQVQEYEALLNIKVKLEAEITIYQTLGMTGRTSILVIPWTATT